MERFQEIDGVIFTKLDDESYGGNNDDRNMIVTYKILTEEKLNEYKDWQNDESVMKKFLNKFKTIPIKEEHEGPNYGGVEDVEYKKGDGLYATVKLYSKNQIAENYDTNWKTGKYKARNQNQIDSLNMLKRKIISGDMRECSLRFSDVEGNPRLSLVNPVELSIVKKGALPGTTAKMIFYSGYDHFNFFFQDK